jgi:4-amino-4-deoxy-L-arabinose transferase-like glycosyltransferase
MRTLRDPLLIVIIVLSLVLGLAVLNRGHDWGDDFASYIMQAKSIWTGTMPEFIEHNRFTIEESSITLGPVAYPWGYPLLLVPAYAVKGLSPLALKLPGLFLFLGFLVCLFLMVRNRLTRTESLLLVSLFAFNPLLVSFHNQITSDISFLFFSMFSLWLMSREGRRETHHALILGAVIAYSFYIRTQGILLLASYGITEFFHLFRNRTNHEEVKKTIRSFLLICASFGVLWLVYALIFPGGGESYFAQYNGLSMERVFEYTIGYLGIFSAFFGNTNGWEYVYYGLSIFCLIGLWVRRKEETIFIVYSVLWMLVLVTWPAWQGPRFIFPLLPIFMYFVFQGMKFVIQKIPEEKQVWGQRAFVAFWFIIIGVFLFQSSEQAYINLNRHRKATSAFETYSMDMYEFVRENTPPQSIIAFFKPRAMRMFTDRDSYVATTCAELTRSDYIVINQLAENSQLPANNVDECGIPIQTVFESKRFLIYKILK